jgi:hypothetical protein
MNIALSDLQAYVMAEAHVLDVDPLLVSRRLNKRPVMANGNALWPGKAMREKVTQL